MGDLMRVPPTDNRVARVGKEAVAGGAVTIIAVLAVSFLLHAVEVLFITGVAILAIGWVLWYMIFRRGR